MSRYIDAEQTLKAMDTWDKFGYSHTGAFVRNPKTDDYVPYVHYEDMVKCVSNIPTADVRENVKGEWILHQDSKTWECSVCHKYQVVWTDYCSHCGADMRN